MDRTAIDNRFVEIRAGGVTLSGNLSVPRAPGGLVLFVHGSGSSRMSPRNQYVARVLQSAGLATLLFDLLTQGEELIDSQTNEMRFDIHMLAQRTVAAADWVRLLDQTADLPLGFFGASTGAAAALEAAARRPELTFAVVSRGGRPDLAADLSQVGAPVLFIVGERDEQVLDLNRQAIARLDPHTERRLQIIPGATHLFEEPGTLEQAADLASRWFLDHLPSAEKPADGS
jgi:pimeloyl-ACP methyl ester carboxylesterase